MRPIIFLDIDGVLNTPHTFPRFYENAVSNFNKLVKEIKPRIVISSSWRYSINPETMTCRGFEILMFSQGIVMPEGSIIGSTKLDDQVLGRENQIKEWIHKTGYSGKWIAIDDLPLDLPKSNFVKTQKSVGFSSLDFFAALRLLS